MREIGDRNMALELPGDYWLPKALQKMVLVVAIFAIACLIAWPPDGEIINPYGLPQFGEFLQAAIHPDLSWDFLQVTWDAMGVTFSYAFVGTALSIGLGFVGACLTSDVVFGAVFPHGANLRVHRVIRVGLTLPRSLHEVIWGLLLINVVGLDPIAGIFAIAIPYGAIVAKIFAEILDDTPRQSLNNLLHAGGNPVSAIAFGLLPRAKLSLISYGFYRFECSLRSAAILGVIGAGGLGYQMMLSLDSLRYEQLWTLFYAIFCLNGLVDLLSAYCRDRIGAPKRFALKRSLNSVRQSKVSRFNFSLEALLIPFGFVLFVWAWRNLNPNLEHLWQSATWRQWVQYAPLPATFPLEIWSRLPWLSLQTLSMSILAIAIAAMGAFIVSWCAATSWGRPEIQTEMTARQRIRIFIAHSILLMMRAIPSPIWALVFLYVCRPGIIVGAIALGVHNIGVMGRLFAEDIENADARGLRSLEDLGGMRVSALSYGLLPSLIGRFSTYSIYRWEVCLRESFILALVGAGGLGVLLKEEISNFNFLNVLFLLIVFWLFTLGLEWMAQGFKRQRQRN